TETLGELHEIRITQLRAHGPVKLRLLISEHIAERVVVEDYRDEIDVVLNRRGQFLHAEHEPAVAGDRDHGLAGISNLHAKSRGEAETQCSLIPAGDERARLIDREPEVRRETHLRDFFYEEP